MEYCSSVAAEADARQEELNVKRSHHGDHQEIELEEDLEDESIVRPPANLLGILVDREKLNTLILKLYPGNAGYALVLKGK